MFRKPSSPYATVAFAGVLSLQLLLSACGGDAANAAGGAEPAAYTEPARSEPARAQTVAAQPAAQTCLDCGTVSNFVTITEQGQSSGVGAALGALAGGLVGSQIGGGNGKRVATAAGVVGGAFAGNNIEKNRNSSQVTEVVISMDNGGERRIRVYDTAGLRVGSRVSVQGETIIPR